MAEQLCATGKTRVVYTDQFKCQLAVLADRGVTALRALRRTCAALSAEPAPSDSVPTSSNSVEQANRSSLEAAEAELDFEIARCAAEVEAEAAATAELNSTLNNSVVADWAVVERAAERSVAADRARAVPGPLPCANAAATTACGAQANGGAELTHRGHEVMHDWTLLLNHTNEAVLKDELFQLPPDELWRRILGQINQSKRDMFQDKYNECKDPACPLQTRSAFIHVLKRVAESFMSYLRTMLSDSAAEAAAEAVVQAAAQAAAQATAQAAADAVAEAAAKAAAQMAAMAAAMAAAEAVTVATEWTVADVAAEEAAVVVGPAEGAERLRRKRAQQTATAAVAAAAPAANTAARAAVRASAEPAGPCASVTHILIQGDAAAVTTNATFSPAPALAPITAPTLVATPMPTPAPTLVPMLAPKLKLKSVLKPEPAPKPKPAPMAAPVAALKAAPVAGTREAVELRNLPTAAAVTVATAATVAAAIAPDASGEPTNGNVSRSSQQPKGREKQPLARNLPATLRSHGVCWLEGAVEGRRLRIYWAGNDEFFEGTIKASPPWQEKRWDWVACD